MCFCYNKRASTIANALPTVTCKGLVEHVSPLTSTEVPSSNVSHSVENEASGSTLASTNRDFTERLEGTTNPGWWDLVRHQPVLESK